MPYQQNVSACMAAEIGAGGLSQAQLDAALQASETALVQLRKWHDEGDLPLLHLPQRRDDLSDCREAAATLTRGARDIVVFGTGGSSLGGQALCQLAGYRLPGLRPKVGGEREIRLHFFDNLDGSTLTFAFRQFDIKRTRFLVISKSGGTPETVIQLIAAIEALKAAELDWNAAAHIVALSEPGTPEKNALRRFSEQFGFKVLEHDPGIGGRYSVLSNVGLLPAMLMDLDVEALREGAQDVLQPILDGASAAEIAPALGAAVVQGLNVHAGLNAVIMMPYADRLRLFSKWFQQLWAESLGKDGQGLQPIAAAGPVDQHSQMQLFLGGPADKLLNIIMPATSGEGPRVPESYRSDPLVGYLANRTIGDLTDCQQRATAATFAKLGRPVRSFVVDKLDERAMGALLMHFMLETILVGLVMGIDPFDQPAVEESKLLTREYLATM